MTRRFPLSARLFLASATAVIVACASTPAPSPAAAPAATPQRPVPNSVAAVPIVEGLPARLTDQEMWKLVTDLSEPDGYFRSDNLLSNEVWLQNVIPDLIHTAKVGRAYMGVGPEQNFTYIAALKPGMVFIVDIRRGNLDLQLMYKALFELSADRADFVSRLFSKKRPEGLGPSSTALEIFTAYSTVDTSDELYAENLKAIDDQLTKTHGFSLLPGDLDGIAYVYRAFYEFGPSIQYWSTGGRGGGRVPVTYADLMVATDGSQQPRSFLATEENFGVLKDLETKNLLVPVVGNFAGPKAIRAVAEYLKQKHTTVSAFYLSNVEQYLTMDGLWPDFCRNVATLPLDDTSMFIRSVRTGQFGPGGNLSSELGHIAAEVQTCTGTR